MMVAILDHITTVDWVGVLGIFVTGILTVIGWVVLRKPKKNEVADTELRALTEYKNTLEKQVDDLRDDREKAEDKQIASDKENEAQDDIIEQLKKQIEQMTSQVSAMDTALTTLKAKAQAQEDRLLEARITISILTQQKNELIRRFNVPTSVADIVKGKQ